MLFYYNLNSLNNRLNLLVFYSPDSGKIDFSHFHNRFETQNAIFSHFKT